MTVSRRRALALAAGTSALLIPGIAAEGRPPPGKGPKHRRTLTASDDALGVDVRTINLTVGTPPGGELMGWELTTSNIGLVGVGIDRTTLATYSGSLTPANGTTITEKKITGPIDCYNGNITIERCWIAPTSLGNPNGAFVSTVRDIGGTNTPTSVGNITIRDCEIDGDHFTLGISIAQACAFVGVATVERCYMHGMGTGIACLVTGPTLSATFKHNYVTGLRGFGNPATDGSHNECATTRDFPNASGRTQRWLNNRFNCDTSGNDTGALFLQPLWDDIDNIQVDNNYLEGGGYNLYIEDHSGNSSSNTTVYNNRFRSIGAGHRAVGSGPGFTSWSENYVYHATNPDHKGAVVTNP